MFNHFVYALGDVKFNLRVSCVDGSVADGNSTAVLMEDSVISMSGGLGPIPSYWDKVVTDSDGTGNASKKL